jgi:hypothetical protein
VNRFEDAIARGLTRRLRVRTRRARVLARWPAAVPPGALVDDAVRLVVERLGAATPRSWPAR